MRQSYVAMRTLATCVKIMPPTTLPVKAMPLMVPLVSMENQLFTRMPAGTVAVPPIPSPYIAELMQNCHISVQAPLRAKPPVIIMANIVITRLMPYLLIVLPMNMPHIIVPNVATMFIVCT